MNIIPNKPRSITFDEDEPLPDNIEEVEEEPLEEEGTPPPAPTRGVPDKKELFNVPPTEDNAPVSMEVRKAKPPKKRKKPMSEKQLARIRKLALERKRAKAAETKQKKQQLTKEKEEASQAKQQEKEKTEQERKKAKQLRKNENMLSVLDAWYERKQEKKRKAKQKKNTDTQPQAATKAEQPPSQMAANDRFDPFSTFSSQKRTRMSPFGYLEYY